MHVAASNFLRARGRGGPLFEVSFCSFFSEERTLVLVDFLR